MFHTIFQRCGRGVLNNRKGCKMKKSIPCLFIMIFFTGMSSIFLCGCPCECKGPKDDCSGETEEGRPENIHCAYSGSYCTGCPGEKTFYFGSHKTCVYSSGGKICSKCNPSCEEQLCTPIKYYSDRDCAHFDGKPDQCEATVCNYDEKPTASFYVLPEDSEL